MKSTLFIEHISLNIITKPKRTTSTDKLHHYNSLTKQILLQHSETVHKCVTEHGSTKSLTFTASN